jgi:hypothetical protein
MKALLILAALGAAYLLWDGYQATTPEGKARSADRAAIENCRAKVVGSDDSQVMEMHARQCAKLRAAFDERWH